MSTEPRIFPIGEMDGFYVDKRFDRTVHVTFDTEDVIVIDVFNAALAAHEPIGETLSIVEINLKSGAARIVKN